MWSLPPIIVNSNAKAADSRTATGGAELVEQQNKGHCTTGGKIVTNLSSPDTVTTAAHKPNIHAFCIQTLEQKLRKKEKS